MQELWGWSPSSSPLRSNMIMTAQTSFRRPSSVRTVALRQRALLRPRR